MLCVWVHGYDPGRVSDGSRLALHQTLSTECPSSILIVPFFCHVFVIIYLFFMLSLEFCRSSSDPFLSSRARTGSATMCITGYG